VLSATETGWVDCRGGVIKGDQGSVGKSPGRDEKQRTFSFEPVDAQGGEDRADTKRLEGAKRRSRELRRKPASRPGSQKCRLFCSKELGKFESWACREEGNNSFGKWKIRAGYPAQRKVAMWGP